MQAAAMRDGAYGCSLSGSGPSVFALCAAEDAERIAASMAEAGKSAGFECRYWVSPLDAPGARVEDSA